MKFIYYLASIGNPNFDIKLKILFKNLYYIYNHIRCKFSIIINCYSNINMYDHLKKLFFLEKIYTYNKSGVLTELWLTNPHNSKLQYYDYILFMLDDVLIKDLNINKLIYIKNKYNLDIISPKVKNAGYRWMYSYNYLTINNALEVFCLLLTPKDFELYASKNSIDNKWMFGVDMLFGYFGMNVGVYHKNEVIHMLESNSDRKTAFELGDRYVQKLGFDSLMQVKNNMTKPVKYLLPE